MHKLKRVLHVPDCHHPFHDALAWKLFLDVAKVFKPDTCVVHGDFFDFYSVSRHDKDPLVDFKTWKDEMHDARDALSQLECATNARTYVFLEGNHEKRLESYVANHAPKLAGIYKTKELLGLPDSWLYLPYGQKGHYRIGRLTATHGSRTGANPTASMVNKYRSSVIHGHTHKLQEHHITDINGNDWVGLGIGWLGDQRKAAEYIKDISDWSLGFAVSWHKPDGTFFYQLIHIKPGIPYQCMFNGEIYVK